MEQLDVSKMEDRIYHFRIQCKKTPGILVQLTRALEALEIKILNANLTSVDDHILNTLVVEVNCKHLIKHSQLAWMLQWLTMIYCFILF